jgi:hypothetical protein
MKRPGRPPLDATDRSVQLCVTLPSKQYDDYARQAQREDVSVPEIIRRALLEKKSKNSPG